MKAPDLIGVAEAVELTGMSEHTIRMWIRTGTLSAWHVGPKRIFVSRTQVESMIRPVVPASQRASRTA